MNVGLPELPATARYAHAHRSASQLAGTLRPSTCSLSPRCAGIAELLRGPGLRPPGEPLLRRCFALRSLALPFPGPLPENRSLCEPLLQPKHSTIGLCAALLSLCALREPRTLRVREKRRLRLASCSSLNSVSDGARPCARSGLAQSRVPLPLIQRREIDPRQTVRPRWGLTRGC